MHKKSTEAPRPCWFVSDGSRLANKCGSLGAMHYHCSRCRNRRRAGRGSVSRDNHIRRCWGEGARGVSTCAHSRGTCHSLCGQSGCRSCGATVDSRVLRSCDSASHHRRVLRGSRSRSSLGCNELLYRLGSSTLDLFLNGCSSPCVTLCSFGDVVSLGSNRSEASGCGDCGC